MKIFILFILFFINACIEKSTVTSPIDFKNNLYNKWIYTDFVSEIPKQGLIDRPKGIEIFLFQNSYLDLTNTKHITNCVYYKIPFKNTLGELAILEKKELEKCPENSMGEAQEVLNDIEKLEIFYQNFTLKFKINIKKVDYDFEFPLYNIKGPSKHLRFHNEDEAKLKSGMILLQSDLNSSKSYMNYYLGKKDDSFAEKTSIQCLKVDKDCQTIGEDFCQHCRFGSYEVIDFHCPQGGSRFCGKNNCGKKNEPACIRGLKTLDNENDGICDNNLSPIFNGEHILFCQ
jgi:hypothetical protein